MIKLVIAYIDENGFGKVKKVNFPDDFYVDKWIDHHYPTCFAEYSRKPLKHRIKGAIEDIVTGLKSRYPICCIINFVFDDLLDLPSPVLRYSDRTEHVECWLCLKRNGGKQRYPT